MDFIKNNKILLGTIIAAAALFFVYYTYFKGDSSAPLSSEDASPVSQELLALLGSLVSIKLDQSIFTDPAFVSLSDFGTVIPPESAGRRNPFAPASGAQTPPPAQ